MRRLTPERRAWLAAVLCALSVAGCRSCSSRRSEVRWPASPDVLLEHELLSTARAEGRRGALLPDDHLENPVELPTDAPGVRARSYVHEGLWVAEVELGEVPADGALPLVVMLHGRGDRPRVPGGPFGRVPTPMRVLVPRGPLALGEGYAWARYSVTQGKDDALAEDLIRMSDRLAELIAHAERTRPTLGTPIVTGFSQGGMLAWTTAMRHPDRVGVAVPIAGWVPPKALPTPLRSAPVRAMHGDDDPIVRVEPTRALVAELLRAGLEVEWVEYEGVGHEVTPEMNATFEDWLEQALRERAPDLAGGLGAPGPDPEPVEVAEPPADVDLEEEAIEAPIPEQESEPEP